MKMRLHWKLMLATTVPVIAATIGIIWLAFDQLAADYFMVLMDKYMVSPTENARGFSDCRTSLPALGECNRFVPFVFPELPADPPRTQPIDADECGQQRDCRRQFFGPGR